MDKAQRNFERTKFIERELGESDDRQDDVDDLKEKDLKRDVGRSEKVALKELRRMSKMNPSSAEYTVSRTYLDWLIDLPWSVTEDILDIQRAADILDEDPTDWKKSKAHFGIFGGSQTQMI